MVSLTTVVLLACACVAIEALSLGNLRLDCMKIRKGSTKGFKHYSVPDVLPKRLEYWEKELPICPSGKTNGVDVQACDDMGIPKLKFVGNSSVALVRSGNLNSYIVVLINLFCDTPAPEPSNREIILPLLN